MKLIFAVDAIFLPLTGIGRYTWELARRLADRSDIADTRFFSMGRWVRSPADRFDAPEGNGTWAAPTRSISILRKHLSHRSWAVHGYNAVVPRWAAYRLRRFDDYLYHSPNYFVPRFDGKSVATVHDLSNYKYPETHPRARRMMFDLQMEHTLSRVSHLITDSEAVRREVIEFFGWPASRVTSIHLGVDPMFAPRPAGEITKVLARYGLAPGAYALCVSTLEPRKRIGELLAAYEKLPAALRGRYPLVLAGDDGWLSGDIRGRLERAQRDGWVRYLGFVTSEDLPPLYAGAFVFCYPSVYEGFGLPVLEAMASGVPVLTSDRSSLPEVADGAAWLVDPDDVDSISRGLRAVMEDPDWREAAVHRGLKAASRKTWDRCMEETLQVYRRVAAE